MILPHWHQTRGRILWLPGLGRCQMQEFQDNSFVIPPARSWLGKTDDLIPPTPVTNCILCASPARVDGNLAPLEIGQMPGTWQPHRMLWTWDTGRNFLDLDTIIGPWNLFSAWWAHKPPNTGACGPLVQAVSQSQPQAWHRSIKHLTQSCYSFVQLIFG